MNVNIKKITTEGRNQNTLDIDRVSTKEILVKLNNEDKTVALAVEKALDQIAKCVDMVYEVFMNDGRLIYMGAGTSGRIGLIDAVECKPTYGVSPEMVQCLMAGGMGAMVQAVEGAEDSKEMAIEDLKRINLTENDIVIGIAASGRTPYVIGGIEYAKQVGAKTASISTSANTIISSMVDCPIEAVTGAEPITGSTRMKSGTAQKMICNMISTASMVKMGKVYQNLMIDVQATNEKLVARSISIIKEVTGLDDLNAKIAFDKYGSVKKAMLGILAGIDEVAEVDLILNKHKGNIRKALQEVGIND
ncbi:MAG: N-acetylmuramic acid 6-phosphate etherase [Bacilli bacterium]|nr:N-acetylmuramic acid 6-phosphate etherase [Bacilli bacterium]